MKCCVNLGQNTVVGTMCRCYEAVWYFRVAELIGYLTPTQVRQYCRSMWKEVETVPEYMLNWGSENECDARPTAFTWNPLTVHCLTAWLVGFNWCCCLPPAAAIWNLKRIAGGDIAIVFFCFFGLPYICTFARACVRVEPGLVVSRTSVKRNWRTQQMWDAIPKR